MFARAEDHRIDSKPPARLTCGLSAVGVLLLLSLGTPITAKAAPAPAPQGPASLRSLTLEQLGNVEVTTYNKVPTELWETPAAVYVITSEQILRSGVTTIADALRLAPGVEVGRYSSDSWAVGIRGLQNDFSKSVLVLIDGRSVYTPLFAGVYWDIQDLPLDDIDHIEVIRGPGGTIWGPNAGNGVINIITKNSSDTHGVSADTLAGTEDHTIDDLQFGGGRSAWNYRIFGRGFVRRHEYHSDGVNDDNWHQERLGFRADRSRGAETYFLSGDLYKGISPQIIGTTPWATQVSGGDINLRWQHKLDRDHGFYLQAYVERTLRNHTAINVTRDTYDIDFIHHFRLASRNLISYGGTLHFSPYLTYPSDFSPASVNDHEHTAFLQDEISAARNVRITVGTKVEHNNYSGFDLQPSGRILWAPNDRQALWGGVTRAVTTPSDLEENYDLKDYVGKIVVQVLGNRNFKSEDVIGYEAGYRRMFGDRLYASLAGFWNQYSRLQSFSTPQISASGGYTFITFQYQNKISGSTSGAELATQAQIARWWRLDANYSFLSSNFSANAPTSNISSSGSVQTYEGSSPKHTVMLHGLFTLPWGLQLDPTYRFVSALPAQKVPAYQTMDLHANKQLGRHFSLQMVGQNLLQKIHYEWGTGDPTQPLVGIYRAAYIQLAFHSAR